MKRLEECEASMDANIRRNATPDKIKVSAAKDPTGVGIDSTCEEDKL